MAGVTMNLDPSWVDAAERTIAAAKFDYIEAAQEDMVRLVQAYEKATAAPSDRSSWAASRWSSRRSRASRG